MILDMWKNKNTYKFIIGLTTGGLIGVVATSIGTAIFNERKREDMSKEKKIQIPEFMKKNFVVPEIDIPDDVDSDAVAETVKEKVCDYYAYMDQCAKEIIEEETREEYTYGQVTVDDDILEQSNKITQLHREKFDYIKGLSPAEQMIVLENIPIELCLGRIRSELDELKEFKSTIYNAMGNFR